MHTGVHAQIFYWWSPQSRKFGDTIMNSQGKNTSLKQAGWNPVDVRTQAAGHFAFPGPEEREVGGVVWKRCPSALRACAAFAVEWVMESPSLGATVRSPGLSVALKDFLVLHLNVHLKSLPSTVAFRAVPALLFPLLRGPWTFCPPTFQPHPTEPGPEAVTSGCSHRTKASQSLRDLVASGSTGPHPLVPLGACGETVECPRADHTAEPRQLCGHLAQAKRLDLPQSLASIPNPLLMPPSVGCWPQWTDSLLCPDSPIASDNWL